MDNLDSDKIIQINQRALNFERFILRRAFGLYYLVWALAILEFIGTPLILEYFYSNLTYFIIIYLIGYFITLVIGISLSRTIFLKVFRTYKFRHQGIYKDRKKIYYLYPVLILLIIVFSYVLQRPFFFQGLYVYIINLLLFVFGFRLLKYIKISFEKVPPEGYIAFYTYDISAAGSILFFIISSELFKNLVLYSFIPWTLALFGWLFCAFYAIYHAPDEVVNNE